MDLKIGPYTLSKRTGYSKLQVFDSAGNNLKGTSIADAIISDYLLQTENKDDFFEIEGDELRGFMGKAKIEYLFIPDEVKHISRDVFKNSIIRLVNFPDGLFSIGAESFSSCQLLSFIELPESIGVIGEASFFRCGSLKKVILPKSLNTIPASSFGACVALEEINIPDAVNIIGDGAFSFCKSLKEINFPQKFDCFGRYPFAASSIEKISINYNIKNNQFPKISYGGYLINSKINKLEISKNVTHIDPNFIKCAGGNIAEVIYLGSKKDLKEFKSNNPELFTLFKRSKTKINITEDIDDLTKINIESKKEYLIEDR